MKTNAEVVLTTIEDINKMYGAPGDLKTARFDFSFFMSHIQTNKDSEMPFTYTDVITGLDELKAGESIKDYRYGRDNNGIEFLEVDFYRK